MRVAAAGEEDFGQRDHRNTRRACGDKLNDLTGSRRQNPRPSIDLLQTDCGRAGENEFVIGMSEGVVGGILGESAAVIRLRTEVTGGAENVQSEVLAFRAFERIVALVADEGEPGPADSRGQR